MVDFSFVGKSLVALGLLLIMVGGFFWLGGKLPLLGRLPGDIRVENDHFKFYFPIATCLLLSIVGSILLWLISKIK